jgi:hypothetical protein
MPVFPGRFAAQTDEPFVVFLIGLQINRMLAIHKWWKPLAAMPAMINELRRHPELGLLASRYYLSFPSTFMVVQYWRSFDDLENFARNPNDLHLPAWKAFNQAVGKSNIVGVFHETYQVQASEFEAVYVNMPRFGLAQAVQHIPATGAYKTARRRLRGENQPAVMTND